VRSRAPRPLHLLLGLVALAAVLRFWRIGHQSYWLDEAFTANVVRRDFGGMLEGVRHTESTPPLYYMLAWLWERVFGWHEAGLRSLSALAGVATVPAAYAAARARFDERAALIAAALFAVNPYFVWYSQEARAYALLVLLCTVALVYLLRGEPWRWSIAAALALLTHYFAAFLILPQAAWLLWRHRSRAVALATAVPVAVAVALLPLAIAQRNSGHTLFISDIPFGTRLASLPKKLATGELGTPTPVIGLVVGAALAAGALLSLRRGGGLLLGLAGANVGLALVLKLAGLDYFFPRNLIEAFVPLLVAVAAGFAAVRLGPVLAAAAALAAVALVLQVSVNPSVQRDDWRGAVHALGTASSARALVVTPEPAKTPLRLYAGRLERITPAGATVDEVDLVANARPPRFAVPPAPPGFRLVSARRAESFVVLRYAALAPRLVGPNFLAPLRLDRAKPAALLVWPSP
jgi:mannosyltransferase